MNDLSQTNWERLDNFTEEELHENALSDPDNPPVTEEFFAQARPYIPRSQRTTSKENMVHLDADVASWFQSHADANNYETAVNAILRQYIAASEKI